MDGCRLFRKERIRRTGICPFFESRRNTWSYVCAQERSQSRVYGPGLQHKSTRTTPVGVFFRPPDQIDIDEAFFRQRGKT